MGLGSPAARPNRPLIRQVGAPTAPTFLGELGEVILQVGHPLPLQVGVELEPRDRLLFWGPGQGEQPPAAEHLLQQPAAHWQNMGGC